MIPPVVHQIWIQGGRAEMPPHLQRLTRWVESAVKKLGWTYRLWSETDFLPLLAQDRHIHHLYRSAPSYASKSDIARILILMNHGGVYLDTDILMLRPHELPWLIHGAGVELVVPFLWDEQDDCLLGENLECVLCTNNCVLAAPPSSKWIRYMVEELRDAPMFSATNGLNYFSWTLRYTGPDMIRRALFGDHGKTSTSCRWIPRSLIEQSAPLLAKDIDLPRLRDRFPTVILLHIQDQSWLTPWERWCSTQYHGRHAWVKRHATLMFYVSMACVSLLVFLGIRTYLTNK